MSTDASQPFSVAIAHGQKSSISTGEQENSLLEEVTNRHLSVPKHALKRQPSVESLYSGSEISELSFGSNENAENDDENVRIASSHTFTPMRTLSRKSMLRSRLSQFWVINYGAFLVLCSQFFGAAMNVCTRLLETPGPHGAPMHPFQILFVRQFITASITTTYALWTKSVPHFPLGPPGKVRLLLVTRGLFGFLGVFGLYFSLQYLPVSEATVLTFLSPIGSCIAFSLLLPGEIFSRQQMVAGCISLIGVLFIARPDSFFHNSNGTNSIAMTANMTSIPDSSVIDPPTVPIPTPGQHLQAVGVALIGVIGAIGALTSIRAIGQRAHALLSVNYFSVWCTIVSLVALVVVPSVEFRIPANLLEWSLLSILGFAGFIMQLLLTKGMAYGSMSAITKVSVSEDSEDVEMHTRPIDLESRPPALSSPETSPVAKSSGAKATSMLYTQMLFALVADKLVFGITMGFWSWFGSILILSGAIWVAADNGSNPVQTKSILDNPRAHRAASPRKQNTSQNEEVGLLSDIGESGAAAVHHEEAVD